MIFYYFDTYPEPIELQKSTKFEPLLFNELEFIDLRYPLDVRSFIATNYDGEIIARLRFVLQDHIWMSLPFCPFGGVECTKAYDIKNFLSFSTERFGADEKLQLIEAPFFYRNYKLALESIGWNKYRSEINHHIKLQEPIAMKTMQLRRLKKCQEAGFFFNKVDNNSANARAWHEFIAECRVQQGLQININFDDFERAIIALPDKYDLFGVWYADKLIAATVVVRVSKKAIYNYLPASTKEYHQFSPMTLLMHELIAYSKNQDYEFLDLGVSSINGEPQEGLCAFKESLGAIRSEKNYFEMGR